MFSHLSEFKSPYLSCEPFATRKNALFRVFERAGPGWIKRGHIRQAMKSAVRGLSYELTPLAVAL